MLSRHIPALGVRLSLRAFVARHNPDMEQQRRNTLLESLRSKIASSRLKRKSKGYVSTEKPLKVSGSEEHENTVASPHNTTEGLSQKRKKATRILSIG